MLFSKSKSDELKVWKDRIAILFLVQQEMRRKDDRGLWQYAYPELAATDEQLAAVEAHLGHSIEEQCKNFLRCANGWKGFSQTIELFGTDDYMGSALMNYAEGLLEKLYRKYSAEVIGFSKEELLPIAVAAEDVDLHVITRPTSHEPGVVIWFADEEIDRFPNFEEYFLAMTDYNRYELENLMKDTQNS